MPVFHVLEFLLGVFILIVLLSQVIIPAFNKRTLFPFFSKQRELEKKEAEEYRKIYERGLELRIKQLKKGEKNV